MVHGRSPVPLARDRHLSLVGGVCDTDRSAMIAR
jgi:hypothetical protein